MSRGWRRTSRDRAAAGRPAVPAPPRPAGRCATSSSATRHRRCRASVRAATAEWPQGTPRRPPAAAAEIATRSAMHPMYCRLALPPRPPHFDPAVTLTRVRRRGQSRTLRPALDGKAREVAAMNTPHRVEHQHTDRGYIPVYATGIVEQPWADYTPTDHEVWATLFRRQREVLRGRACREFLENQERFGMSPDAIPKFDDLNKVLKAGTGWEIVGVEGLLPDEVFFDHLANRRFPVSWWIRKPEQLDYLSEPSSE